MNALSKTTHRVFRGRFGAIAWFAVLYVAVAFVTRCVLLAKSAVDVSWDLSLVGSFVLGLVYDLCAAAWFSLPLILGLTLLPARTFGTRVGRAIMHAALFVVLVILVVSGVAEWFFWDEFSTRFNFIAVDYLVYTTEVLGNIRESYPLPAIIMGVVIAAASIHALLWRAGVPQRWMATARADWRSRLRGGAACVAVVVAFGLTLSLDRLPRFQNNYNRSLAQDGPFSLFAAFWDNELDYEEFYASRPIDEAYALMRSELQEDDSRLLEEPTNGTLRYVENAGKPQTPNIIQITVESLSANFVGALNPSSPLTPNLDALAQKSLLFDNFFATGTRTVRGMEALTMSIPPTPGRSIVKRPDNANLFTLGSVLKSRGYDTAFLYGGYGYFDNMNAFFAGNGYRVVDRSSVASDDVTFATAWGACDEDLFRWTLREADRAAEGPDPFHFFVMTTSNHRPYAYPAGRIDLPPKTSGREGAVKYTDYAIGEFIREASTRPWFLNTVFVIVADHCASSAGKRELPLNKYHIPLLIYAPGGQIAPGRDSTLMSQMDYAPTLLGLLDWSYASRFFGHDVRRLDPDHSHALVATYQLLGHLEEDELTILQPKQSHTTYRIDMQSYEALQEVEDAESLDETIAYYQVASDMYRRAAYTALSTEEQLRLSSVGRQLSRSTEGATR
ncbi:MAG: LTA synthase family protein [Planctomycetes bacterium]|nr:LTA synthase family protein [Planctomycetota bacterium]MCB9905615.1 LTA synthase family protein [Planctomycetota bacterium]